MFDRALLRRRRTRAAGKFLACDFLHARAADDLLDRVESVSRDFATCIVLGGGGAVGRALGNRPHAAGKMGALIETDLSPAMARLSSHAPVAADEEWLPFKPESADLVLSCLSLHWTNDPVGALIQINHTLKPDGFFAGVMPGGASLTELHQAFQAAETVHPPRKRISPFADAIDMARLLSRSGFTLPVSDVDRIKARYDNAFALMRDLRAMGETNVLADRTRQPDTRNLFMRMAQAYTERFAQADGKVPASFELIHFAGWAPHPDQPRPKRPGSAKIRLADALGVTEHCAREPTLV